MTQQQNNSPIKNKTKALQIWDMRYHWIHDKVEEKTFYVNWEPGKDNKAD